MSKALIIREFNAETDFETVEKLEKNCVVNFNNTNVSMFCDMIGDPLSRIKFYPVHVMLVAEMPEHDEELVGVVRGCIKDVAFGLQTMHLKMGFVSGLRVSPRHRQKGIGFNLMKSIEEWLLSKGAEYVYLATEENNVASSNLFSLKCHYKILTQLQIYVLPVENHFNLLCTWNVQIKKLHVNQAVSFYNNQLNSKVLYPADLETILRGSPSLGTWISYFNDEDHNPETMITKKRGSWIVFSLWNNREAYNLHKSFGFIFMYGVSVFGEGKKPKELMKAAWNFAAKMAKDVECKVVMTEVGNSDPIRKYIHLESSMLCINDVWYLKNMSENNDGDNEEKLKALYGDLGNVFVDPRDF